MKCLTNKWREGAMLLSFLLISSLAGIFTACDDIEDEYITDTQLSILQESRTSLNYLLKNSTYGTAPGTYPETGKDILNAAITELDALITRVEAGEELDETTLEAAVAKVNQAIDEFKNSKYYNLSPEAQQYINNLLAKALRHAVLAAKALSQLGAALGAADGLHRKRRVLCKPWQKFPHDLARAKNA